MLQSNGAAPKFSCRKILPSLASFRKRPFGGRFFDEGGMARAGAVIPCLESASGGILNLYRKDIAVQQLH